MAAPRDRIGHAPSIRITLHRARARPDPPRADAAVREGPRPGERPVPAHLEGRSAEGPAEDPEGHPEHARPRAGEDRDEPDGSGSGVLHRGRVGGLAATPAGPTGDGPRAVRLSAARTWGR